MYKAVYVLLSDETALTRTRKFDDMSSFNVWANKHVNECETLYRWNVETDEMYCWK